MCVALHAWAERGRKPHAGRITTIVTTLHEEWRRNGRVLLPGVFDAAELQAVDVVVDQLWRTKPGEVTVDDVDRGVRTHRRWICAREVLCAVERRAQRLRGSLRELLQAGIRSGSMASEAQDPDIINEGVLSMKRAIPLLFVIAILLTLAPSAMANHCYGCKLYPEPGEYPPECVRYPNGGWMYCEENWETYECDVAFHCGWHATPPLASEFEVASVERDDEPRMTASETLVASTAAPTPSPR